MNRRHKPLRKQVIVITGASSGIGLTTAMMAAARGTQVVLAARNEADLARAVGEIRNAGGRAVHVVADVTDPEQLERVAETAVREFGRIDTWVNNAGVGLYGRVMALPLDDMRRQMDVLFWGVVHGSRTAVRHMQRDGGALINVASGLSDRAVPLMGIYCSAKSAVKAFADTLRMELEKDGVPVSVTTVKPASIDTPFYDKARSYTGEEPAPVRPVYATEIVARTILQCAERPVREISAGGAAAALVLGERVSPRLLDRYFEWAGFRQQKSGRPLAPDRADNLHTSVAHDGGERGHNWSGPVLDRSVYTQARLRPRRTGLAAAGVGLALLASATLLRR